MTDQHAQDPWPAIAGAAASLAGYLKLDAQDLLSRDDPAETCLDAQP
jgi:hypothetical protein